MFKALTLNRSLFLSLLTLREKKLMYEINSMAIW